MFRRKRRRVKSGESSLTSNQFPKHSPQPGTPREIQELGREEKGEGRDSGDLGEKRESQ